jgi:hypothetical protein
MEYEPLLSTIPTDLIGFMKLLTINPGNKTQNERGIRDNSLVGKLPCPLILSRRFLSSVGFPCDKSARFLK